MNTKKNKKKPNNINQILENLFEEDPNVQKPPKRRIVNRPQNLNSNDKIQPGRPSNQDSPGLGQSGDKDSPLVGYKNTGGTYFFLHNDYTIIYYYY